jgi:hypothetical protein
VPPLKSKRELPTMYNTPLRKFRGLLESYTVKKRTGKFVKTEGAQDVILHITELQVLLTDAPYPYETAELVLKYSDSMSSAWVILENSIAEVMGIPMEEVSIENAVHQHLVMEREDNHVFFTGKDGKEAKGTVWRVIEVEGHAASQVSPFDRALELLKGKSRGEFINDAVADPVVKKDGLLVTSILSETFFADSHVTDKYQVVNDIFTEKS